MFSCISQPFNNEKRNSWSPVLTHTHTHTSSASHVYKCLLSVPAHQSFTETNLCEKKFRVGISLPLQIVSWSLFYSFSFHPFIHASNWWTSGRSRRSEQLRWIHKKKQISDRDAPGVGCLTLNNVKKHFRRTNTKRFSSILSSWLMHSWMTYGFMGRQANQAVW